MKVFDGSEFLSSRSCEINLSNGQKYVVKDLSDTTLEALVNMTEETPFVKVREVARDAIGATADEIKDVGILELQGALNFLSESLFATESQNVKINDSQESSQ